MNRRYTTVPVILRSSANLNHCYQIVADTSRRTEGNWLCGEGPLGTWVLRGRMDGAFQAGSIIPTSIISRSHQHGQGLTWSRSSSAPLRTLIFVTGTLPIFATLATLTFGENRPSQTRFRHRRIEDVALRKRITRDAFRALLEQLRKQLPHLR